MKLVTNLEGVARARFKAGTAAHLSVIQAQLELGKLDDRLRSLQALQSPVVARLNAALNRPATLPLPWPQNMPDLEVSLSEEQVEEWLAASNPDLIRLGHLARKEDTAIKLAKKDSYPDITFGIEYMDTGEASNPATPDSGKDPVMAMISASVPIWYGKNRSALREARYRKAAVEKELEDTGNHLASDLLLALYHFEDAERKVDLYRDTLVPKAEQSLSVAQQGFEAGNTSFLSLVDAQRLLLEFQLLHEGAISERGKRIAEIEMLTGRRIISD
jgi:outer membrane protein TolC